MTIELLLPPENQLQTLSVSLDEAGSALHLPGIITNSGPHAPERFLEFFTVTIRNTNTRRAYLRQVMQFLTWCEARGVYELAAVRPMMVAAYIEQHPAQAQTVKQSLAAIRMLYDWLVTGQIVPVNPAASVRGPAYSYKRGKTPVLPREDARTLLESIESGHVVGLRDRALIGLMVYSFARVGAATGMRVSDYYQNGKRWWLRLHEKGGKFHEVPVHHAAEEYIDAYLDAAGIRVEPKTPLFRTTRGQSRTLTANGLQEREALYMIKRRAQDAGLSPEICCHTFRATGITAYLENGGTIENAQAIAAHESPRTTKLYDRRNDQISLSEIERIAL
ncbi:MAG: tyrosine-type recombinase/integrase [Abitibacteriaceae bacterium]|nr:tyrosine-type recombinase/integrase [Abditibacteriaceae bacterium]